MMSSVFLGSSDDEPENDIIGMLVRTRSGRVAKVVAHHPEDELLEYKIAFEDGEMLISDWFGPYDVFTAQLPESTKVANNG